MELTLKPFDLEKALTGSPVVTRKGAPVIEIHHFAKVENGDLSVYAIVDGYVRIFTKRGAYCLGVEHEYDMFMAPVKVEKWAVIMDINGRRAVTCGELFDTEEEAVKRSKEIPLARGVARVEWEE